MNKKEKFSNFMERLGKAYIWVIAVAICGVFVYRLVKYQWEVARGREKFYREVYRDER